MCFQLFFYRYSPSLLGRPRFLLPFLHREGVNHSCAFLQLLAPMFPFGTVSLHSNNMNTPFRRVRRGRVRVTSTCIPVRSQKYSTNPNHSATNSSVLSRIIFSNSVGQKKIEISSLQFRYTWQHFSYYNSRLK